MQLSQLAIVALENVGVVYAIFNLLGEMLPPDFSRFPQWIEPILDTLALGLPPVMSIGMGHGISWDVDRTFKALGGAINIPRP